MLWTCVECGCERQQERLPENWTDTAAAIVCDVCSGKTQDMRPLANDAGTLMRCCGKEVCPELTSDSGIAFAVWRCPECETEYDQELGQVMPWKANRVKRA